MTKDQERALAAARSKEMQEQVKRVNAASDLVFHLLSAANYIDALGGDSRSYRAAIVKATGTPPPSDTGAETP